VKSLVAQIQMMTGMRTIADPICKIARNQHREGQHARVRHIRNLQTYSYQQRLQDGNAEHALAYRAYGKAGQRDEILASLRHDPRLDAPDVRN
jgi:hypothetical protein